MGGAGQTFCVARFVAAPGRGRVCRSPERRVVRGACPADDDAQHNTQLDRSKLLKAAGAPLREFLQVSGWEETSALVE